MITPRPSRWFVRALSGAVFALLLGVLALSFARPAAADDGAISIQGFAFGPTALTVAAGTTVTWTNSDTTDHSATADDNSWDTGKIGPNASVSMTFTTPGMYTYHCKYHPFMKAVVIVTDPGAATTTDSNSTASTATAAP